MDSKADLLSILYHIVAKILQ